MADDINDEIGKTITLSDNSIEIKASTLVSLCYPETSYKEKEIIIAVYLYLNETLPSKNGLKAGEYWINELLKDKKTINRSLPTIYGATIINDDFKTATLQNGSKYSKNDFYLGKDRDTCQWHGVFTGKGVQRGGYNEVKERVLKSFQTDVKSNISLVVSGISGSGKSTFLRKLAADSIENGFINIWILNIKDFIVCINSIKQDKSNNYILFIEDWERIKSDKNVNYQFLNSILEIRNVRLVIADKIIIRQEYLDFFNEKNHVELLGGENELILNDILHRNKEWKLVAEKVFEKPDFKTSPLYMILFVIIKSYDDEYFENQTDDIAIQFRTLIKKDLIVINELFPGLAKTLYYWGNICVEYREKDPVISDYGLSRLSFFYNNLSEKQFIKSGNLNKVGSILKSYFSTRQLTRRSDPRYCIFYFHHELIAEYGFMQKIENDWHFDDQTKTDMLNILFNNGCTSDALQLAFVINDVDLRRFRRVKRFLYKIITHFKHRGPILFLFNWTYLPACYALTRYIRQEETWLAILSQIAVYVHWSVYDQRRVHSILQKFIDLGCNDVNVKSAYDANLIAVDNFAMFMRPHALWLIYIKDNSPPL